MRQRLAVVVDADVLAADLVDALRHLIADHSASQPSASSRRALSRSCRAVELARLELAVDGLRAAATHVVGPRGMRALRASRPRARAPLRASGYCASSRPALRCSRGPSRRSRRGNACAARNDTVSSRLVQRRVSRTSTAAPRRCFSRRASTERGEQPVHAGVVELGRDRAEDRHVLVGASRTRRGCAATACARRAARLGRRACRTC